MKKIILSLLLIASFIQRSQSQTTNLPDSIYSGKQGGLHVQGVVVDQIKGYVYFSFTDRLIKTDLSGKLIGSVTGFVGHLGDLDFADDGKIYGSLEYKNDAIGKGIKKELGGQMANEDGFYIAIFDASRIVRPNMNAEKEDLLRTFLQIAPVAFRNLANATGSGNSIDVNLPAGMMIDSWMCALSARAEQFNLPPYQKDCAPSPDPYPGWPAPDPARAPR